MANSKDYWEKRERERMDIVDEITNEEINCAIKDVNAAYAEVQEKITNIYVKYAKDNKLDYSEALKYLKDDERKEFQKNLKFYTEKYHDSEYVKENKEYLHALSARTRVKRLEELQATLKTSADTLYRSLDKGTRASLKTVLEESYKHTAFSILNRKEAALNVPSDKDFMKLMDTPWSGKNYSDKIWDTANNFESKLSSVINKGLIQGKSYEEMARDLRHAQVGKDGNGGTVYECKRLISTEAAFIQQQGTKAYYDEIGLDEYEYCATLDNKTSDICQALDGKLIKVDEARVGVNYPPMHCGCRSTTLPVVRWEGEELGEDEQRMERGDDGRNRIISKVSYDEWKNKNDVVNFFKPITSIDQASEEDKKIIQHDLDLLPDNVKAIFDEYVTEVIFKDDGSLSGFNRKTREIYLTPGMVEGELIHEIGHALEWKNNIYSDSQFLKVLSSGLEQVSCYDIYYDESTYRIAMHRIPKQEKFISDMQTIVYETDVFGNPMFNMDSTLNTITLQEYFSEGFHYFFLNPNLLHKKDKKLYDYIKELTK